MVPAAVLFFDRFNGDTIDLEEALEQQRCGRTVRTSALPQCAIWHKCALVEFKHESDADRLFHKMSQERCKLCGHRVSVERGTAEDMKIFGWTNGHDERQGKNRTSKRHSRSKSSKRRHRRSRSRGYSRSRERSMEEGEYECGPSQQRRSSTCSHRSSNDRYRERKRSRSADESRWNGRSNRHEVRGRGADGTSRPRDSSHYDDHCRVQDSYGHENRPSAAAESVGIGSWSEEPPVACSRHHSDSPQGRPSSPMGEPDRDAILPHVMSDASFKTHSSLDTWGYLQ